MIELFACGPLSASITQAQCAINRESHISCRGCGGLGELVESIPGKLAPASVTKGVVPKKTGWGWTGDGSPPATRLGAAVTQDRILGGGVPLEVIEAAELRTISFDVVDVDSLALIGRVEKIACEHGSTLGDEILLWLQVMDEGLSVEQAAKKKRVRR